MPAIQVHAHRRKLGQLYTDMPHLVEQWLDMPLKKTAVSISG